MDTCLYLSIPKCPCKSSSYFISWLSNGGAVLQGIFPTHLTAASQEAINIQCTPLCTKAFPSADELHQLPHSRMAEKLHIRPQQLHYKDHTGLEPLVDFGWKKENNQTHTHPWQQVPHFQVMLPGISTASVTTGPLLQGTKNPPSAVDKVKNG